MLCADLMFTVQLQSIARAEDFRTMAVRPGSPLPEGVAVLVVNLGDRGGPSAWEAAIREAVGLFIPVVAFGPHMDADARRAAKAAGATRVLANSNLARDLPTILRSLTGGNTQGIIP